MLSRAENDDLTFRVQNKAATKKLLALPDITKIEDSGEALVMGKTTTNKSESDVSKLRESSIELFVEKTKCGNGTDSVIAKTLDQKITSQSVLKARKDRQSRSNSVCTALLGKRSGRTIKKLLKTPQKAKQSKLKTDVPNSQTSPEVIDCSNSDHVKKVLCKLFQKLDLKPYDLENISLTTTSMISKNSSSKMSENTATPHDRPKVVKVVSDNKVSISKCKHPKTTGAKKGEFFSIFYSAPVSLTSVKAKPTSTSRLRSLTTFSETIESSRIHNVPHLTRLRSTRSEPVRLRTPSKPKQMISDSTLHNNYFSWEDVF